MGDGMKPRVRYYRDNAGEWRWSAISSNGNIVADSSEGYERLDGAINGFQALAALIGNHEVEVVEGA